MCEAQAVEPWAGCTGEPQTRPLLPSVSNLGGLPGGWTARGIGELALALQRLAMHSKMCRRHWPPGWDDANSTKCHFLFLFLACFPGRPQETVHVTCLASQVGDGA